MATTRDRIVTATTELFRRRGLNGTSVKQITEAADVTVGSLYHFFPDGKEQLAAEVLAVSGEAYRELFEVIADAAADPVAAVLDFFDGAAAVLEETDFIDPCPIGTVAREVASTDDTLRLVSDRVFSSWISAASTRFRASGMADSDADELAWCLVATIEGGFVLARSARDADGLRTAGRRMARLVELHLVAAVEPSAHAVAPAPRGTGGRAQASSGDQVRSG